jgi:hypothetical protein
MMTRMLKVAALAVAGAAAFALAAPAAAQAGGANCTRDALQDVANRYVKAQHDGSVFALPVGEWVDYRENYQLVSTTSGVIGQPSDFAWHVAVVDPGACRVFVHGVILKPKPYVVGTVLGWSFNGLGAINSVVTRPGDPQFDAEAASAAAAKEDWGEIPADKRETRAALLAEATAYVNGLPGAKLSDAEYTVDEAKGAVAVRGRLGGEEGPAAAHVLRIEGGKVRYDHALMPKA